MTVKYKLPLIIFDSECTLCVRFTQALKALDQNNEIHYESLYNEELYQDFLELNLEDCQKEVHLIQEDQTILKGGEVVEFLIAKIPGVKKISWLIESKAAKGAMNLFYKKINSIRLLKKQGCKTCTK